MQRIVHSSEVFIHRVDFSFEQCLKPQHNLKNSKSHLRVKKLLCIIFDECVCAYQKIFIKQLAKSTFSKNFSSQNSSSYCVADVSGMRPTLLPLESPERSLLGFALKLLSNAIRNKLEVRNGVYLRMNRCSSFFLHGEHFT